MARNDSAALDSPAAAALTASEAIRTLNHQTLGNGGFVWPTDVDEVVIGLHLVAVRMTQAFAQAGHWLNNAAVTGTIGDDRGINPNLALSSAQELFVRAITQAGALASTIDLVHQHTAHLTLFRPQVEGGEQ